ncbi:hypothetical protein CICLE_v10030475mg [Citrus x clementina]|uniref:Uncharacterized protein n=1 Tax=Citrus clementina TaxID=85681 RepID=V4TL83_CITCL|nr:hypothetical protein CICLE_v10030475mg [Citrus x clementina]
MEIELEPRVKPLPYKVKGMSRESPSQKAAFVLDTDLRTHWSTATNTKEWILLELDEPCLLSHIRIYNKSVLEWEISVGLRYKPEAFVKVRPRCEAPRRDMIYPMNYTPCRYVRISCLRGNPIAVFFIQLIGVTVTGLEPEFQPVVNHLLPHIMSHKQDAQDMHLQLLQDMTNRLHVFLPQLEVDLSSFLDAAESNLRFLAMLSGPFYPILHVVKERETARSSSNVSDSEVSKSSQASSALTVSSNFEPRRSRGMLPFISSTSSSMAFRPDAIFVLLRKAYKDADLGTICRKASRVLQKLIDPVLVQEASMPSSVAPSDLDETAKYEVSNPVPLVDYSNLFGEEFQLPDDIWDSSILSILDVGAVEEGILHVLYACASQPLLCSKLAGSSVDFWSALPLVQALLPALRPSMSSLDNVDDSFSQWKQPFVQQALSQIVVTSSSSLYQPLLHACAGYLSSFSPSHAKAACVLIDLCSGALASWISHVVAKGACHSLTRARAALKYIMLALSGHMDDLLGKYKEVKHKILFLLEMLEPFLDPVIFAMKSTIEIGDASFTFTEKQKQSCDIALNVIRTAVQKSAVLPSLESEWRLGSVAPSVLLSILEPHLQFPPEIDLCKSSITTTIEHESSTKPDIHDAFDGKTDTHDVAMKNDTHDVAVKNDLNEDASLFFAPQELRSIGLTEFSLNPDKHVSDYDNKDYSSEQKNVLDKTLANLQNGVALDTETELRASEFRRLASDLHLKHELSTEGHDAAIDALLLAAECYVNPFFVISFRASTNILDQMKISGPKVPRSFELPELRRSGKKNCNLETVADLEKKRDKIVLQLLLDAAELDKKYHEKFSDGEHYPSTSEDFDEQVIKLSPFDIQSADAVTLVRQNQALLCNFLIRRLQKEQHSMHEILMHCLVFFLHSATKLYCAPELVIDIILGSADYLNGMLSSLYCQLKEGNMQLNPEKIHGARRRWILLQRLVNASSGGDDESEFPVNDKKGFRHGNLIAPSVWMQKIPTFSNCASALVRFLGWMAISRIAKQFIKDRLFLVSDIYQLTYSLSIFADELSLVDNVIDRKHEDIKIERSGIKQSPSVRVFELAHQKHEDQSFHIIYPELSRFFPNMKRQFDLFGETILEAVGLQLRSLPSSVVPDILCWFSDLCLWPFVQKDQVTTRNSSDYLKGFVARNAKAVILYVLEAIVIEHMEAMVPEIPRVVQVLVSLCQAPYCDVPFLESILDLLKPIISYSLLKASDEEIVLADESCLNFESLCFDELLMKIRQENENQDTYADKAYSRALIIFILASVFLDLSFQRRKEMLESLILWADFTDLEALIGKLFSTIELCGSLHHQLAKKLTVISAECFMYSRCLSSIASNIEEENDSKNPLPFNSADLSLVHWRTGFEGLAKLIIQSQENHCWEVASVLLDCLLGVPHCFELDNVIGTVCSAIKSFSANAPKIAWRLQIDKWLSILYIRGIQRHKECEIPLVDLFCTMLGHPEPEQRFIALQHLGKFVGQDINEASVTHYSSFSNKLVSPSLVSSCIPEAILSFLVSSTWDRVVVLASSDASLPLRTRAMALLVDYIPSCDRNHLQSFLAAADSVLHGFGKLAHPVCDSPLLQLSLALIAGACLYSPAEDISLIPQSVWNDIETLGLSKSGGRLGDLERKACQVLCRLRNEGDEAKEVLKEVLCSNSSKQVDPDFGTTRESILQVIAKLTSVQSYFDLFSSNIDQDAMELEEAEIELDIIRKEHATQESSKVSTGDQIPTVDAFVEDRNRLQQIKDSILSLEKSKLREEIVARRQKKLLIRHARQKYLEEAALREEQLLQELDRERTAEMEKEIERQRMLELECREVQRELEQAESGLRPSRRDFSSSSHSGRPRERYRERENGRSSAEGTARPSTGSLQPEISTSSSSMAGMPTIVLSGSRSFSGQTPTILQPRDRSDDCGSSYEENFDGSRDSGDTGSIGDPESVSAFDGQSGVFVSSQRHGSRGSKSRQVMERRERDGRREGKWERKH